MNRLKTNVAVDYILGLAAAALTGTGLLTRYVLVSGRDRWAVYGTSARRTFLGLGRHEWLTVHFAIGCLILALIVLHFALHFEMVNGMFRKSVPNARLRRTLGFVWAVVAIALLALPLYAAMVSPIVGI